jgi:hypothetical protein
MPDDVPFVFPDRDPAEEQRRAREFDARLELLTELARGATIRAKLHATLAQQHVGRWAADWEHDKSRRLDVLARILASDEFVGLVRGSAALRALFSPLHGGRILIWAGSADRDSGHGPHRFVPWG